MRNASGQQREASKVKMSGSERKANRNTDQLNKSLVSTYDIFFPIKSVTTGADLGGGCKGCAPPLLR